MDQANRYFQHNSVSVLICNCIGEKADETTVQQNRHIFTLTRRTTTDDTRQLKMINIIMTYMIHIIIIRRGHNETEASSDIVGVPATYGTSYI